MKKYGYEDDNFDYYDQEEYLIENWTTCKFDENDIRCKACINCEYYDECIENAEDNRSGYDSFCDIVSDAYGSVDSFWECNGI